MPLTDRKPQGILRFGLRFPILLYHLRLGGLFGKRFLLLTHIGRKSGRKLETVIEIVHYDEQMGSYYVASGWGTKADWYLNLRKNPIARIMVGKQVFPVQAFFLSEEDSAQELLNYAKRYHFAFKELSYMMTGKRLDGNEESCRQLAQSVPIIRFQSTLWQEPEKYEVSLR